MSRILARLASDYGMVFVLLLLCGYLSWATYGEQSAAGTSGGRQVAEKAIARSGTDARVLIVAGTSQKDAAFAQAAAAQLGPAVVGIVKGTPQDARAELQKIVDRGGKLDVIAATQAAAAWGVLENVGERFPQLRRVEIMTPQTYYWPSFLTSANLLNIANQTAVRAVIAIGMTMVILTGGIDLSVGSLIGLSSVWRGARDSEFRRRPSGRADGTRGRVGRRDRRLRAVRIVQRTDGHRVSDSGVYRHAGRHADRPRDRLSVDRRRVGRRIARGV